MQHTSINLAHILDSWTSSGQLWTHPWAWIPLSCLSLDGNPIVSIPAMQISKSEINQFGFRIMGGSSHCPDLPGMSREDKAVGQAICHFRHAIESLQVTSRGEMCSWARPFPATQPPPLIAHKAHECDTSVTCCTYTPIPSDDDEGEGRIAVGYCGASNVDDRCASWVACRTAGLSPEHAEPRLPATSAPTFQEAITKLQAYWANAGCAIWLPHNTEVCL